MRTEEDVRSRLKQFEKLQLKTNLDYKKEPDVIKKQKLMDIQISLLSGIATLRWFLGQDIALKDLMKTYT